MLTGMKNLLRVAGERNCAVPAFNVYNMETALGVIFAAEETDASIILQMYSRLFTSFEAKFIAPALIKAANDAKVKIALHLDHGASNEAVSRALRYGFTSVMRDASNLPYDKNIAVMKEVVHFCHDLGVDVEGELGHIGKTKDGISTEYTNVEDARRFVELTGVDALAVAVGTAHGHYKQAPVLAISRIRELNKAVDAALVLHGGSGIPDVQITAAIEAGIRKINFGTDVCCSFLNEVRKTDSDIIAVDLFMKEPIQAVKRFAIDKIHLLKAEGSNV